VKPRDRRPNDNLPTSGSSALIGTLAIMVRPSEAPYVSSEARIPLLASLHGPLRRVLAISIHLQSLHPATRPRDRPILVFTKGSGFTPVLRDPGSVLAMIPSIEVSARGFLECVVFISKQYSRVRYSRNFGFAGNQAECPADATDYGGGEEEGACSTKISTYMVLMECMRLIQCPITQHARSLSNDVAGRVYRRVCLLHQSILYIERCDTRARTM